MYARARSATTTPKVAEKSIVWRFDRDVAEDPVDLRPEAHVEHPVGLVEHEHAHAVEAERATHEEVVEASRGCDDDLRRVARLTWAGIGVPP